METKEYFRDAIRDNAAPDAFVLAVDCRCKPQMIPLQSEMTFGRLYDGALCDITVQSSIVGRKHGRFVRNPADGAYYYIDNNSLNGTFYNGRRLESENNRGSRAARLHDGDILRVDRNASDTPHPEAVILIYCEDVPFTGHWRLFDAGKLVNITIGSGENNVIRLRDPAVAPSHAVLRHAQKHWSLFANQPEGVRVNGKRVEGNAHVNDHDVVTIGDTMIIIFGNILIYNSRAPRA